MRNKLHRSFFGVWGFVSFFFLFFLFSRLFVILLFVSLTGSNLTLYFLRS